MALAFKTLGGEGQDVVLIHGFGSDRLSWLGNSPALMPLAKVHALDLPGHGESGLDVGNGSLEALADNVEATLDAQGIAKAHLVAHSLGGGIALLMAARKPERIASLALIAPAGLGIQVDATFLKAYPEAADAETALALLQRLVTRPVLINKMTVQRVLSQLGREGAREALRAIGSALANNEEALRAATAIVATQGIPRMVIWGAQDMINPFSHSRLEAFGGSHHVIADAGHLPHIESAKAANAHLVAFLQKHSAG
jgi:pyruvate dehydrogenase E2 component (dihydrolipoamide acetyltransferase)